MRVALVHQYFDFQGSLSRAHVELTRGLLERGHEVHVYSVAGETEQSLAPDAVFHDVPVTRPPDGRYGKAFNALSFARSATAAVERDRGRLDLVYGRGMSLLAQDIVHLPGVRRGERRRAAAAAPAGDVRARVKRLGAPVLDPTNYTVRAILERRVLGDPGLAAIHVDSRLVRDDLLAHYRVDGERIEVVPTGVNLEQFRPPDDRAAVRRELEMPAQGLLVLFVGHDFRRKGLDRAIGAVARVTDDVRLVVLGGGDVEPYRQLAHDLDAADRVLFVGARSDAHRWYQAADAVILPTRVDMWGAPVIEAMAVGAVPLTSDAAGASDAVVGGRNGFVFADPADPQEMAAALDLLAQRPDLRAAMGRAGVATAAEHTWARHCDRVEADMLAIVERRNGATNGRG